MNDLEVKKIAEIAKKIDKGGLTRRDTIKLLSTATAGAFLANGAGGLTATPAYASSKKVKIVIIGGGLSGMATAARLKSLLKNGDITVVEPNKHSVSYQPGNTFISAGLYKKSDVIYKTDDFIPDGVTLLYDRATEFDPDNNQVILGTGKKLDYDFMVIAAGMTFDFTRIKGLEGIGEMYTLDSGKKMNDYLAKSGACTLYNTDGAVTAWEKMQGIIKRAQKGEKLEAVFSHPDTAIKCGGAPKKIMYLMDARLNEAGAKARENVNMTFYPNGSKMFGVPEYNDAILKQFKARNFNWNYSHNLVGVDLKNQTAEFKHHWTEQGEYDPDLEEYDLIDKSEIVTVPFDFLHIAPPAKAPDEIGKSPVGSAKGWVPVHKETMQHVKYKNIFSLGDIAAIPLCKTGGSARKQYRVLCDNLVSLIDGKEMTEKFDGYTVCPIITGIGTVMLAEFDWSNKPKPTFPLDPTEERYAWWLLKAHILKPMTQYGMLAGIV